MARLPRSSRQILNKSLYNIDDLKLDYHVKDAKGAETASGALTGKISADVGQATYAIDDVKFQGKLPLPIAGSQPTDVSAGWATARLDPTTQQLSVTGVSLKALDTSATISRLEGTNMIDAPQVERRHRRAAAVRAEAAHDPRNRAARRHGRERLRQRSAASVTSRCSPRRARFGSPAMTADVLGMKLQGDARSEKGQAHRHAHRAAVRDGPLFKALGDHAAHGHQRQGHRQARARHDLRDGLGKATRSPCATRRRVCSARRSDRSQGTGLDAQARYTGSIHVDNVDPASFMAVFGKLVPAGINANELGQLALDTRFDSQSAKQLLQLDELRMTSLGLQFAGNLTLSKFPSATEYNGDLSVAQFSPRALLKRFGAEPPVTADPKVLTAAAVKTRLSASGARPASSTT